MSKFEAAEIADENFSLAARELRHARNALTRSKSKANATRFVAAESAFDDALAVAITAREAYEAELRAAEVIAETEAAAFADTQLALI